MARSRGREQKRENPWERIQRSPMAGAYLAELFWLARDAVESCERIFDAAQPPPDATASYIKVDHRLQADIYHVLNSAARIRALIKDRPRRQQSAAQYAIQA